MRLTTPWIGLLTILLVLPTAHPLASQVAQTPGDTVGMTVLDTLRVGGRIDDLIGIAASASEGLVGSADLRARPITREGELLETVPGMIVTQHSGEGKANQYFVRGFNLDHGTDFQTRVEGMPVNMATHGHGQGWTDLNFLIPELVDFLDYRLGVHHAELGDFGSAGGAEFHLVRELERPFAKLGVGENGYARMVAGGSARTGGGSLLLAGEARGYDGPWELDQDLRKLSGLARYSWDRGRSRFSVLGMGYRNRWTSTDQIPRRAVERGIIGRLGYMDPTDGGSADRYSLSADWRRSGEGSVQHVELFGIVSDLDLYSNFTYYLEDADLGDQFNQRDRRVVLGGNARHVHVVRGRRAEHTVRVGVQTRTDLIDEVGLHRTRARERTGTVRDDRVRQHAAGAFVEADARWFPWLRTVLGLRADAYGFHVESDRPENTGDHRDGIVSPKASLVVTPSRRLELYLSGGYGFHSNDARGTTITLDPATGEPAERVDPLVRSRGAEVGARATLLEGMRSTLTLWALDLESELLFVGDAGATEPSVGSERRGITWANFYRVLPYLTLDADASLARARLVGVPREESHIPGALERVVAGGMAWSPPRGLTGGLRVRHFGAYPLREDDAVRAEPATLLNATVGYSVAAGVRLDAAVLNALDSRAADIQYYYPSRLPGEPGGGVEDVHFHPVEPRQVRLTLTWRFGG